MLRCRVLFAALCVVVRCSLLLARLLMLLCFGVCCCFPCVGCRCVLVVVSCLLCVVAVCGSGVVCCCMVCFFWLVCVACC